MNLTTFKLLTEGKKDAVLYLQKQFPNNRDIQAQILDIDKTPSKGDVVNIAKWFKQTMDINLVATTMSDYYQLKSINISVPISDDFTKFSEDVDERMSKILPKDDNVEAISNTVNQSDDTLVETDDLLILDAGSKEKCIVYGKGYKFCISRKDMGNMYKNYRFNSQSSFYFIFFKDVPKTNSKHIMVLDVQPDNRLFWTFANNNTAPTTWERVFEQFPQLVPYKDLLKHVPLSKEDKDLEYYKKQFVNHKIEFMDIPNEYKKTLLNPAAIWSFPFDQFVKLPREWRNEVINGGFRFNDKFIDAMTEPEKKRYLKILDRILPVVYKQNSYGIKNDPSAILNRMHLTEFEKQSEWHKAISGDKRSKAQEIVDGHKSGPINLENMMLTQLPNMRHLKNVTHLNLSGNKFKDLQGCPFAIKGSLTINHSGLESLVGCPQTIGGSLIVTNNKLSSLEGCATSIKGNFDISGTPVGSLAHGPQFVGGHFNASQTGLTSLEGFPKVVGKSIYLLYNKLETLSNLPNEVNGDLHLQNNKLTSLKGCPRVIIGSFRVDGNQIKDLDLEHGPDHVDGDINLYGMNMTSLRGFPTHAGGVIDLTLCKKLESLEGLPSVVNGKLTLNYCRSITSLKGGPEHVKGSFIIHGTAVTSLKYGPLKVDGSYLANSCKLTSLEGLAPYIKSAVQLANNPKTFGPKDKKAAQAQTAAQTASIV